MKIESAKYVVYSERPFLELVVDGKRTLIGDFKENLFLEEGVVPLHSLEKDFKWEDVLPEITLPAKPERGQGEHVLRGFTKDPVIIGLARDYLCAINRIEGKKFIEGPLEIKQ